jgi:hypothetical protein
MYLIENFDIFEYASICYVVIYTVVLKCYLIDVFHCSCA